jgi:hypothetical protein
MEFLGGIDYNTAEMKPMKKSKDRALFQATVENWPENKLSWSGTYINNLIKMSEESDEIQDAFGELVIGYPTKRRPFNYNREIDTIRRSEFKKLTNGLK